MPRLFQMATAQHPLALAGSSPSRRSTVYTFALINGFAGLSIFFFALCVLLSFALSPGDNHGGALLMVVQAIWVLSTVCHAAVATDFLDTKHPSLTSVRALAASPSVWLSIFAVVLAAAAAVDDNRNTTLALCTRLAMLLAPSINILSLMLEKRTDFSNRGGYDGIVCRVTIHTAYLLHCRLALRGPQTSCYCARRYDAHGISIFGFSPSSRSDAVSILTVAFVAFYATEYSLFTVQALDSDASSSSGIQAQWSCFNVKFATLVRWLHRVSVILGFCAIPLIAAALVIKNNRDLVGNTAYYLTALAVIVGAISISFASEIVELRVCRRHRTESGAAAAESGAAAAVPVDSEAANDGGNDSEADAPKITSPRAGEFCVAGKIDRGPNLLAYRELNVVSGAVFEEYMPTAHLGLGVKNLTPQASLSVSLLGANSRQLRPEAAGGPPLAVVR